jgi:hypothetical protein
MWSRPIGVGMFAEARQWERSVPDRISHCCRPLAHVRHYALNATVEVGDRGPAVGLEFRIALEVGSRLREI